MFVAAGQYKAPVGLVAEHPGVGNAATLAMIHTGCKIVEEIKIDI